MSDVILYTTEDGKTQIDLHLKNGTVWLSQQQIADLFQTSKQNISKHVKAIYEDQELDERATVNQQLTVQKEGSREVSRTLTLYNLDVILAVGYRVRSARGVEFRRYASTVLKEYLEKGFALNDDRLKNLGGGNYWKELLVRIRDIRSSEKVMYRIPSGTTTVRDRQPAFNLTRRSDCTKYGRSIRQMRPPACMPRIFQPKDSSPINRLAFLTIKD